MLGNLPTSNEVGHPLPLKYQEVEHTTVYLKFYEPHQVLKYIFCIFLGLKLILYLNVCQEEVIDTLTCDIVDQKIKVVFAF